MKLQGNFMFRIEQNSYGEHGQDVKINNFAIANLFIGCGFRLRKGATTPDKAPRKKIASSQRNQASQLTAPTLF